MIQKIKSTFKTVQKDKNFYEILSGSALTFIAKILAIILGLVLNLIIARYYGAAELGIYSIIASVFSIALIFSALGTNTAILRLIPEQIAKFSYNSAYHLFWKIFKIVLIMSTVIGVGIYIFSELIAENIFHKNYLYPLFLLLSPIAIFQSLGNLSIASVRALKNIKLYALYQIFVPVVQVLLLVVLTIFFYQDHNPVHSLMLSFIISAIFSLYLIIRLFRKKRITTDKIYTISTKQILAISLPMMLTTAMGLVVGQTDILMLGAMSTAEVVGIYAISMKLALLSTFILTSINIVIAPKISELYYSNKLEELQRLIKKTSMLITLSSLPILLVLIIFGKSIMSLFGDEFILGYSALMLLLFGHAMSVVSGPVEFFLNMTGHQKNLNYIVASCAVLNIILNYVLIPIYGLEGAAFASMVSITLSKFMSSIYIRLKFGFFIMYTPLAKVKK